MVLGDWGPATQPNLTFGSLKSEGFQPNQEIYHYRINKEKEEIPFPEVGM
jgi:hypothetical protein